MNIKVFGCPGVKRELYLLAALSQNDVDIEIVSPETDAEQLQQKINCALCEMVVLAFGQRRLSGLCSGNRQLIAPKAHNCAHLLLGSTERYHRIFSENDDSPLWLNCGDCSLAGKNGAKCVVRTSTLDHALPDIGNGVREYTSDLSLLKSLLDLTFDDSQAIIIPKNSRITTDPVDIIAFEPL